MASGEFRDVRLSQRNCPIGSQCCYSAVIRGMREAAASTNSSGESSFFRNFATASVAVRRHKSVITASPETKNEHKGFTSVEIQVEARSIDYQVAQPRIRILACGAWSALGQ
jgi:hypothetical protein